VSRRASPARDVELPAVVLRGAGGADERGHRQALQRARRGASEESRGGVAASCYGNGQGAVMKRWMVAGALLVGCTGVETETRAEEPMMRPVAPKKAAAKMTAAKPVEMPLTAEARIDPVSDSAVRGAGRFA